MVGEALGARPNWVSYLLCDLCISLTLSGPYFDFIPSSRFSTQSNVVGKLLHKVELLVCFHVYLYQTSALRTNIIGICHGITTGILGAIISHVLM